MVHTAHMGGPVAPVSRGHHPVRAGTRDGHKETITIGDRIPQVLLSGTGRDKIAPDRLR